MFTDELLTTAQVAVKLGVTPRTVARMVERGELTPVTQAPGLRGARFFDPADLLPYLIKAAS